MKNVFWKLLDGERMFVSGHKFMKCYEYSPGIRIKGLKRNKVVGFAASDRFIPKQTRFRVHGTVDSTTFSQSSEAPTKERDLSAHQGGGTIWEGIYPS